jgi:hypothetical protein
MSSSSSYSSCEDKARIKEIREKLKMLISSDEDEDSDNEFANDISDNESVETVPLGEEDDDKVQLEEEDTKVCSICFQNQVGRWCWVIPCLHLFHIACVQELLGFGTHCCPLCRKEIEAYLDTESL